MSISNMTPAQEALKDSRDKLEAALHWYIKSYRRGRDPRHTNPFRGHAATVNPDMRKERKIRFVYSTNAGTFNFELKLDSPVLVNVAAVSRGLRTELLIDHEDRKTKYEDKKRTIPSDNKKQAITNAALGYVWAAVQAGELELNDEQLIAVGLKLGAPPPYVD